MHIGIDARMAAIPGGHGRYITNLVRELMAIDTQNRYTLFILQKDRGYFSLPNDRWQIVVADVQWYTLREQFVLPRILARHPVDLMHFPHWNVPLLYRRPFVVTIHDLTLLRFPSLRASTLHPMLYKIKEFGFKLSLRHAAQKSVHVVTPSEFVKKDVVEKLHILHTKVTAVYEGMGMQQAAHGENESASSRLYLLYVGVAYPHKNLERTIDAFMRVADTRTQFVLAGRTTYFHEQLEQWVNKKYPHAIPNRDIVFTGEVDDSQLASLYAHARGFVYCSLSEGFGLPPLEALSHGTPVLASNTTCLPEILGDAAILVNPEDTDAIAHGMRQLIGDEQLRVQLLAKAPEILSRYSWRKMAEEILKIYKNSFR